jgi:uncharacterized protein YndB with AHSA1/START domain
MTSNHASTQVTSNPATRELTVERVFNAPRELVFQMWQDPQHLAHWWGPKGWTLPICTVDFRPGGIWHYCMRGPDGEESWGKAFYEEIVAPDRIVYRDTFIDAEGNVIPGTPEMLITVSFTEQDGKTKLTSTTQFATVADLEAVLAMGAVEGIGETWDRLEEYLAQQ